VVSFNPRLRLIVLGLVAAVLLAFAYGGPMAPAFAGEETPVPTDTPAPTDTPVPTNTPLPTDTPAPTNTPVPTGTPVPTDTPEPTATETPDATQTAIAEDAQDGNDDGGGNWWMWLLLILGAVIVIGAIAGYIISRQRQQDAATAEALAHSREEWQQSARLTYGKASSLHGDLRAGLEPPAGVASTADDLEWLNRQSSRLDEVGFELGRLAMAAPTPRDRTAVESLQQAVGEFRAVITQRLSPTGFATPADYQQSLSRELFELDAAVRAFQTTL
jgi:hypothetical protein